MAKTTHYTNGHQRSFFYEGQTINVLRPTNRDRERMRKLLVRLSEMNLGYTGATLSEFAAAVSYTISGDSSIWNRPHAEMGSAELAVSIEEWLDVDSRYIDELFLALDSKPNPITAPAPLPENAAPNS